MPRSSFLPLSIRLGSHVDGAGTRNWLGLTLLYYIVHASLLYYMRHETGIELYSPNPVSERMLESYAYNPGIDKNGIVLEFDKAKHHVKLSKDDRYVLHRETRYPRLDRLIEEHF